MAREVTEEGTAFCGSTASGLFVSMIHWKGDGNRMRLTDFHHALEELLGFHWRNVDESGSIFTILQPGMSV